MTKKYVKELEDLIGYQLMDLTDDKILVRSPEGKIYTLFIEDDEGDCCGFNDITTTLKIERNSETNPIITKIERDEHEEGDGDSCTITFYGDSKILGDINTYSSSGSGWAYGATVSVRCDTLSLLDILSSW